MCRLEREKIESIIRDHVCIYLRFENDKPQLLGIEVAAREIVNYLRSLPRDERKSEQDKKNQEIIKFYERDKIPSLEKENQTLALMMSKIKNKITDYYQGDMEVEIYPIMGEIKNILNRSLPEACERIENVKKLISEIIEQGDSFCQLSHLWTAKKALEELC